jgi:hypothetical protein
MQDDMGTDREKIEKTIRSFLDGTAGQWDWDDFISVPLRDRRLEAVRRRCVSLPELFPPHLPGHYCSDEGSEELCRIADELALAAKSSERVTLL